MWYRSKSWAAISQKTAQIEQAIANMHPSYQIDNGRYRVRLPIGMPFAQRLNDPEDDDIRGMVLNVEWEFLTTY